MARFVNTYIGEANAVIERFNKQMLSGTLPDEAYIVPFPMLTSNNPCPYIKRFNNIRNQMLQKNKEIIKRKIGFIRLLQKRLQRKPLLGKVTVDLRGAVNANNFKKV